MSSKLVSVLAKAGLAIIVLAIFFGFYQYLQNTKPEVIANTPEEQSWTVNVIPAKISDATPTEQAFGTVRAAREAELRFGVAGEVDFISDLLRDGMLVAKAERLAQLDRERLKLALQDVKLQIQAEENQIEALTKQVSLRERTVQRTRSMFSRSVATEANLDEAELALSVTANQLAQAKAKLSQLRLAERNRAKDIEDSVLIAPFTGRLSMVKLGLGNRVSNANMIARLTDLDSLEVPFVVSAEIYSNLSELMGKTVSLSWQAEGKIVSQATAIITRAEVLVDRSEGGGKLFAELVNDDSAKIPPGAFVQVTFSGKQLQNVYELPEEALVGSNLIFIAKNGRASQRSVTVQHRAAGRIWVTGDIAENEQVIATRLPGIGDGLRVRVAGN